MTGEVLVALRDVREIAALQQFADRPWQAIIYLNDIIMSILGGRSALIDSEAWIHPSATLCNSVVCAGAKIYEGATVRDSYILPGATIGHCSEVARSIIGTNAMVPRLNYVGSSIIGSNVQLGGTAMLASRRHDRQAVTLHWGRERIALDVSQFGSIVGDDSIIAYGVHLNPGTVVAHNAWIMPYADLHGFTPTHTVTRTRGRITRFAMPRSSFGAPHGD